MPKSADALARNQRWRPSGSRQELRNQETPERGSRRVLARIRLVSLSRPRPVSAPHECPRPVTTRTFSLVDGPRVHAFRLRSVLALAAAARAQLSHMSLPGLAGVDPQEVHVPDATRSFLILRADALSPDRQELQRCVFVSFGPPHAMQMPDASSLARIARCDALNLSPQVLQRCVSVSFGPPHKLQRPDATRSALFARFNAFCSARQELQRAVLVSVGMPHEMQRPVALRSALFALKGALCFSRQDVQRQVLASFGLPHAMQSPCSVRFLRIFWCAVSAMPSHPSRP